MFSLVVLFALVSASVGAVIPDGDGSARIVGGREAQGGQFPYQAAIRSSASRDHLLCGGAILNARYVLTAARCLQYVNAEDVQIRVGSTSNSGGTALSVEQIILHESYDPENLNNDIALIRTRDDIPMGPTTSAVLLPAAGTPAGAEAVFSGWGRRSYPSQNPASGLRFLPMRTISQHDCDGIVGGQMIGGQNLCALPPQGAGLSTYDDGGPLVVDDTLVGVASWNIPGGEGYPQIFTDVHYYANWIFKNAAV